MRKLKLNSQITFLYYKDFTEAKDFFENILNLEIIDDQGDAIIYRIAKGAFIGIVDEKKGHCKAQDISAVLITLVTDNVKDWYEYLLSRGVKMETPIQKPENFPVECFFFKGPGGYEFEVQKFLISETLKKFK
jgi:predicted enzyme related to lactoylglutathione lyase